MAVYCYGMHIFYIYKSILLLLFLLPLLGAAPAFAWEGVVSKITDGDTLQVRDSSQQLIKVRLYGVDCPEKRQPFGAQATELNRLLLEDARVEVQTIDTDRYGRQVALVQLPDGSLLQEKLLIKGLAWIYPRYCRQDFCTDWKVLEQKARERQAGLWQSPATPPWQWRRMQRGGKASSP